MRFYLLKNYKKVWRRGKIGNQWLRKFHFELSLLKS